MVVLPPACLLLRCKARALFISLTWADRARSGCRRSRMATAEAEPARAAARSRACSVACLAAAFALASLVLLPEVPALSLAGALAFGGGA